MAKVMPFWVTPSKCGHTISRTRMHNKLQNVSSEGIAPSECEYAISCTQLMYNKLPDVSFEGSSSFSELFKGKVLPCVVILTRVSLIAMNHL